jgi:hypothetical protein
LLDDVEATDAPTFTGVAIGLAPVALMPTASVAMTTAVYAGLRRSERRAWPTLSQKTARHLT